MKVAKVVMGFPCAAQPSSGIFNWRAAKALSRAVDITVVHLRTWRPGRANLALSEVEGVPVVTVAVPQVPYFGYVNIMLYRYLGWFRLRSLFQTCNLIHSVDATFASVLASTWGRWAHVHHITQIVGGDINSILPRKHACRGINGWEDYVHGVACNSHALAKAFVALYPQARHVRTIYRGVDLQRYHPLGPATGPLAHRPPVRFLFLGGFPAYPDLAHGTNTKGGDTLLAAWQEAEANLIATGASLLIAGPESNTQRVARWRANLRHPSQVHIAGHLHPDMVPAYLRSSDVVLIPSMEEGLPNVAMEAAACGRPVFGSDIGGIPEVVVDGETGLVLPAGEVAAWRNALTVYAGRLSHVRAMGQHARQRMEALFDSGHYTRQMLDLYQVALREPLLSDEG